MATKNRLYPHLLAQDIEVWERFLERYADRYDHFDYDVRVGQGRDPGDQLEPKYRQLGIELSQRRIDAIGHRQDGLDIIEITTEAGIHAVGQLIAYPILYEHTFQPNQPLRPVLVCSSLGPDVKPALDQNHILTFIFP